jgi:hypothetical protein
LTDLESLSHPEHRLLEGIQLPNFQFVEDTISILRMFLEHINETEKENGRCAGKFYEIYEKIGLKGAKMLKSATGYRKSIW